MFDNDTKENWSTVSDDFQDSIHHENETLTFRTVYQIEDIIHYIVLGLTLSALLYGAASWYVFKKFRNYRNYVFLNSILANFLLYSTIKIMVNYEEYIYGPSNIWAYRIVYNLYLYLLCVKNYWLLVISHMFYVNFVKVFNGNIQRKYLKSSIFAWGVALITTILFILLYFCCLPKIKTYSSSDNDAPPYQIAMLSQILPLIVNFCFYFIIVFSLCRSFNKRAHTAANIRRRLYIATVIFLISDVLLLSDYVVTIIFNTIMATNSPARALVGVILNHLNAVILPIFLFVVKCNRNNWHAFYLNKTGSDTSL